MNLPVKLGLIFFSLTAFVCNANGQADQFCGEAGLTPSLDSPFAQVPYIYGRVVLKNFDPRGKLPNVTVVLVDGQQSNSRWNVGKSGNYCFRLRARTGGTIFVEVDGIEISRRTLPSFGAAQQREDFEIYSTQQPKTPAPGVISAKFIHPVNPKTVELYKKAAEAESKKDSKQTINLVKQIVLTDPADFIAWAKLGMLYLENNSLAEAESAFRKSLELKVEYTPAWLQVGQIRVAQKQFEAAIEIFKHAAALEPTSAKAFRLLGEAYLQARQGTLGEKALNEAIRLDPDGMAECHLLLARLYELAGAKKLVSREYKLFLSKQPNHRDKKKFEQFIKNNPE